MKFYLIMILIGALGCETVLLNQSHKANGRLVQQNAELTRIAKGRYHDCKKYMNDPMVKRIMDAI